MTLQKVKNKEYFNSYSTTVDSSKCGRTVAKKKKKNNNNNKVVQWIYLPFSYLLSFKN